MVRQALALTTAALVAGIAADDAAPPFSLPGLILARLLCAKPLACGAPVDAGGEKKSGKAPARIGEAEPETPPDEAPQAVGAAGNLPAQLLSDVPHRVLHTWGRDANGRSKGAVGYSVVVDPSISNAALARLAADVLAANEDAEILSVRIYDDEEATSYERHLAHDPFVLDHTVGQVWLNKRISVRKAKVRGEAVDLPPTGNSPPADAP